MSAICLRRFPGEHPDRSSTQANDAVQYGDLIGKGAHAKVYEVNLVTKSHAKVSIDLRFFKTDGMLKGTFCSLCLGACEKAV